MSFSIHLYNKEKLRLFRHNNVNGDKMLLSVFKARFKTPLKYAKPNILNQIDVDHRC